MAEQKIKMEDPSGYISRLECGVALLRPIAFSLEKDELAAADYADALYGALEYLGLLVNELAGSLCIIRREDDAEN